jgi:hypothetical protein
LLFCKSGEIDMAQMLHTHPYRLSTGYTQQATLSQDSTLPSALPVFTSHLQAAYRYAIKIALVFLVSVGFLACASYIMASPAGLLVKLLALTAWACGFVPVSYYLWSGRHEA